MRKFLMVLKVHTAYLTPQESMLQISSQSATPFDLEVGEHRDIESQTIILIGIFICTIIERPSAIGTRKNYYFYI